MKETTNYDIPIYNRPARLFHWWVALLILLQMPIGFYMHYRRTEMPSVDETGKPLLDEAGEVVLGVFDDVTKFFYSSHKLIGLLVLLLVLLRLSYRLIKGAPQPDPSVPPLLTKIARVVHLGMYALLLLVPIGGYIAISYGGYLNVFGITLPAITAEDKKFADELFEFHGIGATVLLALVGLHIFAAFYHRFLRGDRVLERMLPRRQ